MNLYANNIINNSLKLQWAQLLIFKRYKSKKPWKCENNQVPYSCIPALKHFDEFYKSVFKDKWPSVRLGLLSKPKYFAVINNFGEAEEIEKHLLNQGAFNVKTFLEVQKNCIQNLGTEDTFKMENKTKLKDTIKQQFLEKQEKDLLLLHPEGKDFQSKVDHYNNQDDSGVQEHSYTPADARTALESDLKEAKFELSRLITPGSESKLLEFVPVTKLRGAEKYIAESDYYKYYNLKSEASIQIEEEHELEFPENLKVYSFDRGEVTDFPEPVSCINNVYNYLKIDGAELLAALALGVKPEDSVLDLCSKAENIMFCLLQTLLPKYLIFTNDVKGNTKKLFSQYLCEDSSIWNDMLYISSNPLNETSSEGLFHKVLINVPSTDDKTSLFEENGNIFLKINIKRRLRLPEVQCSLLVKGMKLVRPGGTVLYTTSTLSPVQNEGVVNEAVRIMLNEHRVKFTVRDISPALRHTTLLYNFGDYLNMTYGTLVVPFLPVNFGPRYICKLVRNETQEEENVS